MSQRRRLAPVLVVLPLLLSAGCTTVAGHASPAAGSTAATRTTSAESRPTAAGPSPTGEETPTGTDSPADTAADGGPAQPGAEADPAGQMRVSGIRITSDAGYTRLVIDLSSHGVPAWTARYTEASGPGGGPVEIEGTAFLRVALKTGADPGNQGQNDTKVSPGPVAEARTTGSFDGSEEVLIGMRNSETPFRAFARTDPGRIVIDVRPGG